MKKICFVTAARSEYGALKWLMKDIKSSNVFQLQLVVTGGHLCIEQGHTIDTIIADDFDIDEVVDIELDVATKESIAKSLGRMSSKFASVFSRLQPDYIAVLGDRYELLPIVTTAFIMGIPIIHISGGDVTKGAIDDGIRNAVTMLSDFHFPGTQDSAENIIRMRGSSKNVWFVGEPGLDLFYRESLLSKKAISENLGLDENCRWALFTYHPETKLDLESNINSVNNCMTALLDVDDLQVIATYSNADYGGSLINDYLDKISKDFPLKVKVVPSLGNKRYLSLMSFVSFVIGNSSSGIIEAPFLGIPVINIGNRQSGRHLCRNIIQSDNTLQEIVFSISKALNSDIEKKDFFWGDGHTAEKILSILKNELT